MGILDDYADLGDIEANTGFEIPEGTYEFIVAGLELRVGTNKDPDAKNIITKFILNDGERDRTYNNWTRLPADPSAPTDNERTTLSIFKGLLLSLGLSEAQASSPDEDDIVGISGVLQVVNTKGRNGNTYQNLRNIKVGESSAPGPKAAPKAAEEKPKTATRRPRATKPAPKAEPVEEAVDLDDNPEGDYDAELDEAVAQIDGEEDDAPMALADDEAPKEMSLQERIAAKRAALKQQQATGRPNPFAKK